MPWIVLIDGVLWMVTLAVSIFLGWAVWRRRDLPARLFLGMVLALAVLQLRQLAGSLAELFIWLLPGAGAEAVADFVQHIRPLDTAAVVLFGCLNLHLFLIFPTKSRIIRFWRWSPVFFYAPGAFLTIMMLSRLGLEASSYRAFWGLDGLGLGEDTLQLLFIIATFCIALLRLLIIYVSRASPLVRQQLAWILWGFVMGGSLAILTDYLPAIADLPRLADYVPGFDQLPILIILGSFALSIVRYQIFDVEVVINRSVVYSILMVVITLLYLALATLLGALFQAWSPDTRLPLVAILTTLIVVLAALPLRDAIQRLVDRYFLRSRADYRRLLQEYSRALTTLVALPRLLTRIAEQVEEILHPSGLAIVLAGDGEGYRVALSRGRLASQTLWQEGVCFAGEDFISTYLATQHRPCYLPWHAYEVPEHHEQEWQALEASGVHALIPMHLQGRLAGWLVLGPKLSDLAYTRRDLDFLSALADQSCVALENARLYGEMQQRATELAMVSMVSSAISSSLELEHVLRTIVESVIQVVGCDKSAISELSEDGSELDLRMARGFSPAYIQQSRRLRVGEDNRTLVITTRHPLIVTDVWTEPRLNALLEIAEQEGYRALIDIPLVGREGLLGVLSVYFASVHRPSASELEVLTTFANHAAIAIENARLYTAVTRQRDRAKWLYEQTDAALARRVEQLTSIEEVSRQLAGTLDLQQVMDLVLKRVLHATQADRGVIALRRPYQDGLWLLAQKGYPTDLERYRTEPWPLGRGITGRVARTGILSLVPDVTQDPDFVQMIPTTRSQLSVPIIHDEGVLGVITLESDRRAAFAEEQVHFVELLAGHAAIGINNAQLFQQVMEGRDRLQAILNSTHDVVIVLDTTGQVILANPRTRELFGPAVHEWLRSANVLEVPGLLESQILQLTDLDAESLAEIIEQARQHPDKVMDMAFSFLDGDQQRHVEGTASPVFSATGEVIGRVAVLRDVSHQQELEQFRQDLTSMVIHNLQGPLAAMISTLEALREDVQGDPDMAAKLLDIALGSGRDLYRRIESLLWIRRLEDKEVPLDLRAFPVPELLRPVLEEYMPMARAAGVDLQAVLDQDLPLVVVDQDIMGRVISNLLDNALKYTPAGGRVQVQAVPDRDPEHTFVLCSVTDTGPGIPSSSREAIFDMFRRVDQSLHGRRKGMGIGLHYCKLAVEAHGGRIWVESEEGHGSAFYFTLPAATVQST